MHDILLLSYHRNIINKKVKSPFLCMCEFYGQKAIDNVVIL